MKHLEIERKFLIKKIPDNLWNFVKKEIIQGYIENEDWKHFRIRKEWNVYSKTIKTWSGLIRQEDENEISKEEFEKYWKSVWNVFLEKTRYEIPYLNHIIELDIYKWILKWLSVVEVEFDSEKDSEKFIVPDWFDKELTENKKAKNYYLAKYGIDKELK